MGLQRGWPDFLLIAPGGRLHALELKRRGETMTEEQEAFEDWCREQGVPFACTDDLREALAALRGWGAFR
jgi:thiamine monophosphate synthase